MRSAWKRLDMWMLDHTEGSSAFRRVPLIVYAAFFGVESLNERERARVLSQHDPV